MDLPNIQQNPSYETLFTTLKALESFRDSGYSTPTGNAHSQPIDDSAVKQFSMAIISSDLTWLSPEEQDVVYDLASKRIAERCGRSAMPTMTRTWTIPESISHPEISLKLREPALTGDNLGHKTWGTSFALAKKLEEIGQEHLNDILSNDSAKEVKILELGSGTGLVGLAAASIWRNAEVTLTDLAAVMSNLEFNVSQNTPNLLIPNPSPQCRELNWYHPRATDFLDDVKFEIVIAADPLYDDEHPEILANTIDVYGGEETKVLVAVPFRDRTTEDLSAKLDGKLGECGWVEKGKGEEILMDGDWETSEGKGVKMVWSVWERTP